jgi:hypothetical protein
MMTTIRGNLKTGFSRRDPPRGVEAVDSIVIAGRRKGELRPGDAVTLVDQSRFEVHTAAIHRELVGWHWKLLAGTADRVEAVVEVFNYGNLPVLAYLTRRVGGTVPRKQSLLPPNAKAL